MMAIINPHQMLAQLTERQLEVLKGVCAGKTHQTIADELVIVKSTVTAHVGNIYQKLGLDELDPTPRRKILIEEFCPALRSKSPKPRIDTIEPEPVPENIRKMVDEDEQALLVIRPKPEASSNQCDRG